MHWNPEVVVYLSNHAAENNSVEPAKHIEVRLGGRIKLEREAQPTYQN